MIDSYILPDAIKTGTLANQGLQVRIFSMYFIFLSLKIICILVISAEPDEVSSGSSLFISLQLSGFCPL